MSDKTMEAIKSGKGLPPLSNNNNSNGTTTEQRAGNGVSYEQFTYHGNNKENNNSGQK